MADLPLRIQRKRTKGWRMPAGAVNVTRPGILGNPFVCDDPAKAVAAHRALIQPGTKTFSISGRDESGGLRFAKRFHPATVQPSYPDFVRNHIGKLRGKSLACWCDLCEAHAAGKPLGVQCSACAPCHADTLLELANPQPKEN